MSLTISKLVGIYTVGGSVPTVDVEVFLEDGIYKVSIFDEGQHDALSVYNYDTSLASSPESACYMAIDDFKHDFYPETI